MVGVVADRVIVELEAKLDRYTARVDAATRQWSTATNRISTDAKRMESQIARSMGSIRSTLLATTGLLATAFGVSGLVRLADSYTRFTNQLKLAGLEGARLAGVQNDLFTIAQRNGVPLEALGTLYGRVAQSARELGASEQQLLQFTSGVAAALRIQGGDAAASSGALLQLSQALGGAIVRAEEFNSINEGARPILSAVAVGMEKYRGSVSRLRADVIEGRVTSREFFEGFLRGSQQLEQQATRANLTIGQSLTVLSNAFSRYIGETDAAHGVTQRISAALQLLANNLDTIIPALANIALLMGGVWLGRFVAGMVAAAGATGVASTAFFALQARAVGAATSMEAVALTGRAAGAALLGAFGGPVGLAVTALAAGMYLLATATDEATESLDRNVAAVGAGGERYRLLYNEAKRVREANQAYGDGARIAVGGVDALTGATARLTEGLRALRIEQQFNSLMAARRQIADANTRVTAARAGLGANPGATVQSLAAVYELREAVGGLSDATVAGREAAGEMREALRRPGAAAGGAPAAAGGGGGRGRGRRRSGPDAGDITRRYVNETAALEQQLRDASAQLVATREARVAAELAGIETDRQRVNRDIEGNEHYDATRKAELTALNDRLAVTRRDLALAENEQAAREQVTRLSVAERDNEIELAQATAQLADTTSARKESALELLRLSTDRERIEINAALQARGLSEVEERILRARLAYLDRIEEAGQRQIARDNETPGQRYRREAGRTGEQINEDLERVGVEGLGALNDGITDAIMGTKSLGEVFKNVANQIIADLIRIAVQRAIIAPLANALFPEGGGGIFSALSSAIPGRASGGHVSAGSVYRVQERGLNTEVFAPNGSGKILPLNNQAAMSGYRNGGGTAAARVIVEFRGDIDGRIAAISGPIAVEVVRTAAPRIVDAAEAQTLNRARRPGITGR